MNKPTNPFVTTSYIGSRYFCDREKETRTIISALENGRNLTLIARRRVGKSTLLKHVAAQMEGNSRRAWKFIELDLMQTSNYSGFYSKFAEVILSKKPLGFLKKIKEVDLIRMLRLGATLNHITGMPEFTADLKEKDITLNLGQLFKWIGQEKNVVIVFDEFQQVLTYPESNVQGIIRSEMMANPSIRFIFCGSDQHLLSEMFSSSGKPFYNSTENMGLDVIPFEQYQKFIRRHFTDAKRKISDETIEYIYKACDQETTAIQRLCNHIFDSGSTTITQPIAQEVLVNMVTSESSFPTIRATLRPDSVQFELLKALARYDFVEQPNSKAFMKENGFTNNSSIKKAMTALIKYGYVSRKIGPSGSYVYFVDNALLRFWLNTLPR